jgi:hypothetical protein
MLTAFIAFAAEVAEAEPSKTPFYIAGCLLAAWAVVVSAIGIARNDGFPANAGAQRGIMGISALLVAATMAAAIVSS